jgi:DNA-binding MltR family transcriptional regulator
MPKLEHQDEIDAYYLADPARQRAAGVLWPALVERRVDKLFDAALRPDKVVRNDLFQPSGALGNYAVKVRLAYMLGWFAKDMYDDLILVGKIRNRFAHAIEAKDFSDPQISSWLKAMNAFKMLPGMLENAKKEANEKPGTISQVKVNVLEDALGGGDQMGFRWCIDLMLHYLDKYRANMERNLASLPESWLMGEDKPLKADRTNTEVSIPVTNAAPTAETGPKKL